jgi:Thioredoxin like C-terminal domain
MLVGMAAIFSAVRGHCYTTGAPRLNEWGIAGEWTIGKEHATLGAASGSVVYRFHARDLHLVLGPGSDGKPVRFRVTVDDAPGNNHGADINAAGEGVINEQRLY